MSWPPSRLQSARDDNFCHPAHRLAETLPTTGMTSVRGMRKIYFMVTRKGALDCSLRLSWLAA